LLVAELCPHEDRLDAVTDKGAKGCWPLVLPTPSEFRIYEIYEGLLCDRKTTLGPCAIANDRRIGLEVSLSGYSQRHNKGVTYIIVERCEVFLERNSNVLNRVIDPAATVRTINENVGLNYTHALSLMIGSKKPGRSLLEQRQRLPHTSALSTFPTDRQEESLCMHQSEEK